MYEDGYRNIVGIDISETVIEYMISKSNELGYKIKHLVMDARDMEFKDNSFEAIIDKGTIDAILCGNDSISNVDMVLSEVYRCLSRSGVFLLISFGKPENRMEFLQEYKWQITCTSVRDTTQQCTEHFIYSMVKQ